MARRFSVEATARDGTTVLALAGELDHDTAAPLREALAAALRGADPGDRLLVDCADLRFCDSTGLNVLLRARLAAEQSGGRLELSGLRQPVARMFRITGADGVFRVYPSMGDAFAPAGGAAGAKGGEADGGVS
ncbi:STAS domain-containing protein [Streptomyces sp. WAC06614]|uniref:STAS domain-containing protein n=1 Tax=Streptomyces sp. WAC06614 TaxID=2487416 RepID=UPI000F77CEA1|nr:STAS domain-containing protein [Streptomyces sp. WAC06614]RSS72836.1 anti-sigma factor antagonist [Streptomyces sp. WAC06614]